MKAKILIVVIALLVPAMASAWTMRIENKSGKTLHNLLILPEGVLAGTKDAVEVKEFADKQSLERDLGLLRVGRISFSMDIGGQLGRQPTEISGKSFISANYVIEIYERYWVAYQRDFGKNTISGTTGWKCPPCAKIGQID